MKNLQYSDIIKIHKQIISKFGGEDGILNDDYINSALNSWKYSFDGELLYKTVLEQCVKVAYELIRQHPFRDGNKRVGIISLLALLEQNGINVKISHKDLIGIGYAVASGMMEYDEVVNKIKSHINESILNEVYPNKGESKEDFISRFMKVTKDEYPDRKQRYAVALSYWDRRNESVEDYSNNRNFRNTIKGEK